MKKAPLLAIAAAALFLAGAGPATAGDRDGVSFSFGVLVNDGHRHYRDRNCDRDGDYYGRRVEYSRPYYYGGYPRERVVVIERGHRHWHHRRDYDRGRHHYHRDRYWD